MTGTSEDTPAAPAAPAADSVAEPASAAAEPASPAVPGDGAAAVATPGSSKVKANTKARRKSAGGGGGAGGKKLNRKGSKAKITHIDAQPGDHFFVKLKGFPQWPVIICDEDMLPTTLTNHRPVTARRKDGTYRDDFADGGKKAGDRTFPVMYLYTNEL